jgi:hypothetical protein
MGAAARKPAPGVTRFEHEVTGLPFEAEQAPQGAPQSDECPPHNMQHGRCVKCFRRACEVVPK